MLVYGGETSDGYDGRRPPRLQYQHQPKRIVMQCGRSYAERDSGGHQGHPQHGEHDVAQQDAAGCFFEPKFFGSFLVTGAGAVFIIWGQNQWFSSLVNRLDFG